MSKLDDLKKVAEHLFKLNKTDGGITIVMPDVDANWHHQNTTMEAKDHFREKLHKFCHKNKVTNYFFISEAWMSVGNPDGTRNPAAERQSILSCMYISAEEEEDFMINAIIKEGKLNWEKPETEFNTPVWRPCLYYSQDHLIKSHQKHLDQADSLVEQYRKKSNTKNTVDEIIFTVDHIKNTFWLDLDDRFIATLLSMLFYDGYKTSVMLYLNQNPKLRPLFTEVASIIGSESE